MTRSPGRARARIVLGCVVGLLVLTASPAAADPPGPTNYRAEVQGLRPPVDGVTAEVLGGDSFLQLRVAEGHEVVVPGYDGEELYLRYDADGSVHVNLRSVSHYQNQSRYDPGAADRPAEVGADVPPEWQLVSTDGTYAWHDHRIHWMSPNRLAPAADGSGDPVDPSLGEPQPTTVWAEPIPIRADGDQVGITGELVHLPPASPLPTVLAAVAVLVAAVLIGRRSAAAGVLAGVLGGAVVAVAVSLPQVVGLPAGVEAQPLQLVLPGLAVVVALAGWAVRGRSAFGLAVAGAGGVPLLGWTLANLGGLTAAIVPPESIPDLLGRLALGVAAGGGLGAVVVGVGDLLGGDALSLDPGPDPA